MTKPNQENDSEPEIALRLHITDTPGAAKRYSETVESFINLMGELGAPEVQQVGVEMRCDGCGTTTAVYDDFDTARAASRAAGWVTVKADDFCPDCRNDDSGSCTEQESVVD